MDRTGPDIGPSQPLLLIDLDNCPRHLSKLPVGRSTGGAVQKYIGERLRPETTRPQRRQTLLKSIRSFFESDPGIAPESVLKELMMRGVVRVGDDDLVSYRDKHSASM